MILTAPVFMMSGAVYLKKQKRIVLNMRIKYDKELDLLPHYNKHVEYSSPINGNIDAIFKYQNCF